MPHIKLKVDPPATWYSTMERLAQEHDLSVPGFQRDGKIINFSVLSSSPSREGLPSLEERIRQFQAAALKELTDPREVFVGRLFVWLFFGSILLAIVSGVLESNGAKWLSEYLIKISGICFFGSFTFPLTNWILSRWFPSKIQKALQRQEELFNRLAVAKRDSDSSTDLVRYTLVLRAGTTRDELSRLWTRSAWAFLLGVIFLLLAIFGPLSELWFVLRANADTSHLERFGWLIALPGISLSILSLSAATVLFRHDNRLRAQYQTSADEVAYFDRLQVAIDCARAIQMSSIEQLFVR